MPGTNNTDVNQTSGTITQEDGPRGVEDRPKAKNPPAEVPNQNQTPQPSPEKM